MTERENVQGADLQTEEIKRDEIETNTEINTETNTLETENVSVTKTANVIAAGTGIEGDRFLNFLLEMC